MSFDAGEYERIRAGAQASAAVIVPILAEGYDPRVVYDVGCGEGWFAQAFALDDGAPSVVGIDIARPEGFPPEVQFLQRDLAVTGTLLGLPGADLVLCLEVAEHLPPDRSQSLVAELAMLAPTVAFSAAVPGQTGHGHINCRPASYWADLFAAHGYRADSSVRGMIWDDERVEPWYRQNLIVYDRMVDGLRPEPFDVIHPAIFAWFAPKV